MSEAAPSGAAAPASAGELGSLRQSIDAVDTALLDLIARRRQLSTEVAALKTRAEAPLRDARREESLLARLVAEGRRRGIDGALIAALFERILDDSVRLQQAYVQGHGRRTDDIVGPLRVSCLGRDGSYSHIAARRAFSSRLDQLELLGRESFAEVLALVESGDASFGVVPIENTTSGSINEVYDLLLASPLSIVSEEKIRVDHVLVGLPGVGVEQVRRILTHPQGVAQCRPFLSTLHDLEIEFASDTATAAWRVATLGRAEVAAIASEEAANAHGLEVLRRGVATMRDNWTRFLVLGREPVEVDPRIPAKTSLVFSTATGPGSLADSLQIFARHGLNLTKIQSRPSHEGAWEERFHVDFEGTIHEPRVLEALGELRRLCREVRVLGSYPRAESRG